MCINYKQKKNCIFQWLTKLKGYIDARHQYGRERKTEKYVNHDMSFMFFISINLTGLQFNVKQHGVYEL